MIKVAIQGIKGCFHEMAARKYFDSEIEVVESHTFKDLCFTLKSGGSDLAIMAIENTLAGSLLPNYALIERFGFTILGEVYLPIRMNLLGLNGATVAGLKKVYSHPVALAQCEEYLERFPHITVIEYHDTAAAARWVQEEGNLAFAAISNELSAEIYGLDILQAGIETHKQNFTRFLIVGREEVEIENANKASLSLRLAHEPGALADVLTIFKNNKNNLTKIQSIPIIGMPYQYAFKIDVTWNDRESFDRSLTEIRQLGNECRVVGCYVDRSEFSSGA